MSDGAVSMEVLEAHKGDAGSGVARISAEAMEMMGAADNDIVEIRGKRRTAARCIASTQDKAGRAAIRMNGLSRHNAGAAIGGTVRVHKIAATAAEKVIVRPFEAMQRISGRDLAGALRGSPVVSGNNVEVAHQGDRLTFRVVETAPAGEAVMVTEDTAVRIAAGYAGVDADGAQMMLKRSVPGSTYADIGGMSRQVARARAVIEVPLTRPEAFERLGAKAPKGIVLRGPRGTGKTLLARAAANAAGAHMFGTTVQALSRGGYTGTRLRRMIEVAKRMAPAVIHIDAQWEGPQGTAAGGAARGTGRLPQQQPLVHAGDRIIEFDALRSAVRSWPSGGLGPPGMQPGAARAFSVIGAMIDGIEAGGGVSIVVEAQRAGALPHELRKHGRFSTEIELGMPDAASRAGILAVHTKPMRLAGDVSIDEMASETGGLAGEDLARLCAEAAAGRLGRMLGEGGEPGAGSLVVERADFAAALDAVSRAAAARAGGRDGRCATSDRGAGERRAA